MSLLSVTSMFVPREPQVITLFFEDNGVFEYHRAVSTIDQLWVASWSRSCLGKIINFGVFDLMCVIYHFACNPCTLKELVYIDYDDSRYLSG